MAANGLREVCVLDPAFWGTYRKKHEVTDQFALVRSS